MPSCVSCRPYHVSEQPKAPEHAAQSALGVGGAAAPVGARSCLGGGVGGWGGRGAAKQHALCCPPRQPRDRCFPSPLPCSEAACLRMRRAARAGRPPEWVAQEHPCCNRLCLMCMRARRAEWRADRQQERRQTLMVRRNGWRSCTHSHGPRRRLHEGLRAAPRRSYDAIRLARGETRREVGGSHGRRAGSSP